jgi:putative endonuclease
MNLVYILHSTKLNRLHWLYFRLRRKAWLPSKFESRKFTHNASDWITFLKIECQSKKQALQIEKQIKNMKARFTSKTQRDILKWQSVTWKLGLKRIRTPIAIGVGSSPSPDNYRGAFKKTLQQCKVFLFLLLS